MQNFAHPPFWPFVLLLILLGIVLFVRAKNPANWNLIFRSTYDSRAARQSIREENVMENTYSGILVFVFFLSFAMLLFELRPFVRLNLVYSHPLLVFSLILFSLFITYFIKVCILYFLQIIFEKKELFDEYIIVFMNINIVFGILIIPLILLSIYSFDLSTRHLMAFSLFLLCSSVLLRFIRVFDIGLNNRLKWYNIILYLCTLEILPIILIMTLMNNIGITLNLGELIH